MKPVVNIQKMGLALVGSVMLAMVLFLLKDLLSDIAWLAIAFSFIGGHFALMWASRIWSKVPFAKWAFQDILLISGCCWFGPLVWMHEQKRRTRESVGPSDTVPQSRVQSGFLRIALTCLLLLALFLWFRARFARPKPNGFEIPQHATFLVKIQSHTSGR